MVSRAAKSGVSVRALAEFGLALRSGPFRVAIVLSLVVHLALLGIFGRGEYGREGGDDRRIPLMRVRLLSPASPAGVPAVPVVKPAVRQPRREQPDRPAATVPPPLPAATLRAPENPVPAVERVPEPAPAQAPEIIVHDESPEQRASEEIASPPVAAAPPPPAPSAPSASLLPEAGVQAIGPVSPVPVSATAGGESGNSAAPGSERDGHGAPGVVAAGADASGPADTAAVVSAQGPGPRDLAAVRNRIDAHKVYPQIAVRNGWEGRVLVEMRLEGDGNLTTVRLLEGSGYAVLDDATISAVRRASPFPAVARVLTVPVEYRLLP